MNDLLSPPGLDLLRFHFDSGATRGADWRRAQLSALARMITEQEAAIVEALQQDLGKPAAESFLTETGFVQAEIAHTLRHLRRWMRPRRMRVSLSNLPGRARIVPDPKGVVLIMAPWNYPFQLAISPLVGALAAGNCAVIKPSELAPATAALLARIVPDYLPQNVVQVVTGGPDTAAALLARRFDHIFFTGSTHIGKTVMQAAAQHLTPVTLELGGKSPCILAPDTDLRVAARRIAWGKFLNAGQTCVAPDYILTTPGMADPLARAIQTAVTGFFGPDPQTSPDYGRIIHDRHFDRLVGLLDGGRVVMGGTADRSGRYIAPTVLRDVDLHAPLMREEIFGPLLPIIEVPDMDSAIRFVADRPKPLALYLFTKDRALRRAVTTGTSSGALCINDVVAHLAEPDLPFGGVGDSGIGAYHGVASFETFSHHKPVLTKPEWGEPPLRYAPYTPRKMGLLRRILS